MRYADAFALIAVLSFASAASGNETCPNVTVTDQAMAVTADRQQVSINLGNAVVTLDSPYGTYQFVPFLSHRNEWVQPSRTSGAPAISRQNGSVRVEVTFPVEGERTFTLQVDAYKGIPAVFVTSWLRVVSGPRPEYYFWNIDHTFDHYWASKSGRTSRIEADKSKWSELGFNDWFFLPGKSGGLALFSRGEIGRAPGQDGCPHIWALPRSKYLALGSSMDAGFGIAGVRDADETDRLWSSIRARKIPALSRIPDKLTGVDYGRPAPLWLQQAESYNGFYQAKPAWDRRNIREKLSRFPLIVGVPHDKAVIDRCHRAGIRVIAYVNYMELLDTEVETKAKGRIYYEWLQSAEHESLDIARHRDWVCIGENGEEVKSVWGSNHGHPGLFYTCFHQAGLQQAALGQVRAIMEMGADGVFIDNAGAVADCCGDRFGRHPHPDPSMNNTQMYELLQRRIYELVKSFGEDRIVMQNSGIIPSHWAYCDAQMWEACVWGNGTPGRMQEWEELEYAGTEAEEAVKRGKTVVLLSYLDAAPKGEAVDRALYAYCYARLFGFLWADWFGFEETPGCTEPAHDLYSVRLGRPVSSIKRSKDAIYRVFEHGIVLVNPTASEVSVEIPARGFNVLKGIGRGGTVTAARGALRITLPPDSGRVFLKAADNGVPGR